MKLPPPSLSTGYTSDVFTLVKLKVSGTEHDLVHVHPLLQCLQGRC
jgi:hypothetical protein